MANLKWSDMADKNISMKMEFWWNVTKESDCNVAKVKAIVRIEQIIMKFVVSFVKIIVFFFRKTYVLNLCVRLSGK